MYKGEEFEVQQLHLVEKLEKAHQDLAKQWQELDIERQKSNEEQEQQRRRIQLFAQEQAEVQAGLQMQFESEAQKREEWEAHQQQFLEQQQQQLEDHWQREQEKRKKRWEKEQEEEFMKLQQRFQLLQQQFQERLDAAEPRDRARTQTNLQNLSRSEGTKSLEESDHQDKAADVSTIPNEGCMSRAGCLQGCFQGFQSKVPREPRQQGLQESQAGLFARHPVDMRTEANSEPTGRDVSTIQRTTGSGEVKVPGKVVGGEAVTSPTETSIEPRSVATHAAELGKSVLEAPNEPRKAAPMKSRPSMAGTPYPCEQSVPPSAALAEPITAQRLREPLAQLTQHSEGPSPSTRQFAEKFSVQQHSDGMAYHRSSSPCQFASELGKVSKHEDCATIHATLYRFCPTITGVIL